MKEEFTRELLEAMAKCSKTSGDCSRCGAYEFCRENSASFRFEKLATALLEEMDKPKDDVWKFAASGITTAEVFYGNGQFVSATPDHTFTRELPKTRIDKIVEEVVDGRIFWSRMEKNKLTEMLKSALEKYAAELGTTT